MEITVTPADVTQLAPEFAETSDEIIQAYIDIAKSFVCAGVWGSKSNQAVIFMTAHMLKDIGFGNGGDGSSNAAGAVTMEKVGDLQRSYASVSLTKGSTSDMLLAGTKYGRLFIMLRKTISVTPRVL